MVNPNPDGPSMLTDIHSMLYSSPDVVVHDRGGYLSVSLAEVPAAAADVTHASTSRPTPRVVPDSATLSTELEELISHFDRHLGDATESTTNSHPFARGILVALNTNMRDQLNQAIADNNTVLLIDIAESLRGFREMLIMVGSFIGMCSAGARQTGETNALQMALASERNRDDSSSSESDPSESDHDHDHVD